MKTIFRIFRIIFKLLLLAYVAIMNLIFIVVFYSLLLTTIRHICPNYVPGLFDEGFVAHLVNTMPFYLLSFFILYTLSPLNVWMMCKKEGYKPLNSIDRVRLERLLSEMGINRKLKFYRNGDVRTNAVTFGFNTIGITGGMMQQSSDEELKGVICHEVGHILHYDFVYQVLLFSMESFGRRCLYGIFLVPDLILGIIGSMVSVLIPAFSSIKGFIGNIWWSLYKLLYYVIYGISQIFNANINKYSEYRCDAYAVKYGCGNGLLLFLHRLKKMEEICGERPTFTEYIMSTHPTTEKRILRLEKLL